MNITQREQESINLVVSLGKEFGFGNMIAHLQSAWEKFLVEEHGFTEDLAKSAATTDPYPRKMHEDLMNRGEWDETGVAYRD